MYIGQLVKATGASAKAIRHYEEIGLIAEPLRKGKYRVYTLHDVKVITMIRRAQQLGFRLSELKQVVKEKTELKAMPFDTINELIDSKVAELYEQSESALKRAESLKQLKQDLSENFS